MPLLSVVLPLWVVRHTEAPPWLVSVLLMVNMLGVALFQVRLAARVTGPVSACRSVRAAGALLLVACCAYALSAFGPAPVAVLVLLVAAALQVVGEMMQGAGAWELGFVLAPPGRQGQYQGCYGMGAAVARMVGPLLLTTLVLGSTALGWVALGALFASAALATTPAARWAMRTRADPPSRVAAGRS